MKKTIPTTAARTLQSGATLIVGLVLLLVLTVLGISGMNTARMEVQMAGNTQFQQDAFQLAESGIDVALGQGTYTTAGDTTVDWLNDPDDPDRDRRAVTRFTAVTPVPDIAFSMGTTAGSISAYHFDIESVGRGPRNATSVHNQSFYVVGPGSTEAPVTLD